jgi:hypothetical protein
MQQLAKLEGQGKKQMHNKRRQLTKKENLPAERLLCLL